MHINLSEHGSSPALHSKESIIYVCFTRLLARDSIRKLVSSMHAQHPIHLTSSLATEPFIRAGIYVRRAGQSDLVAINDIVIDAITTWSLSDRVLRMAKKSLTYTEADLEFMTGIIGEDGEGNGVAAALWEPEAAVSAENLSIQLHGLYVKPEHHRRGIGAYLVEHVIDSAKADGFEQVFVKAWREAEIFFLRLGFCDPDGAHHEGLYPRLLCRNIREGFA